MKIEYKDIPRIPRKLKKEMKKEGRYTTKKEWLQNEIERLKLIR